MDAQHSGDGTTRRCWEQLEEALSYGDDVLAECRAQAQYLDAQNAAWLKALYAEHDTLLKKTPVEQASRTARKSAQLAGSGGIGAASSSSSSGSSAAGCVAAGRRPGAGKREEAAAGFGTPWG